MRSRGFTIVRTALGASLALNVVLGGLLLHHPRHPPGPDPLRLQRHIETLLSAPDRAAFDAVMQQALPQVEQYRRALWDGGAAIKATIGRQPFDAAALRAGMAANRQNWTEFSTRFDESMVRAMSAISAEGRRRVADDMSDPPVQGKNE